MGYTKKSKVNWSELSQYCITERETTIINERIADKTVDEIAASFGLTSRVIYTICSAVKSRAARKGHAPEHDMTATAPDGFQVKGVSTYYNSNGQPTGQWVKTVGDKERQHEIKLLAIEETHKN